VSMSATRRDSLRRSPHARALFETPEQSQRRSRQTSGFLLGLFFALWLLSLDQYLFIPAATVVSVLANPERKSTRGHDWALLWPMIAIAALAATLIPFTDYLGDSVRTLNVWLSGALLVWASYGRAWATGVLVRSLFAIWVASMGIYLTSVIAPPVTTALLSLKLASGPASSRIFWTPSQFFDLEVLRPIGFALYANELALFGLVITATYCWWFRPRASITVALVILSLTGLVLSTSRSLVLTTAVVLCFLLVAQVTAGSTVSTAVRLLTILGVLSLILLAFALNPYLIRDLTGQFDALAEARYGASADLRELSYVTGVQIFQQNWFAGVGGLPSLGHIQAGSHSLPISIAVRHGVLGLIALGAFILLAGSRAIRVILRSGWRRALVAATLLVALISCTAIQFDDDVLSFSGVVVATTLLGASLRDRESPTPANRND
jgi:hypothetical protein